MKSKQSAVGEEKTHTSGLIRIALTVLHHGRHSWFPRGLVMVFYLWQRKYIGLVV